MKVTIFGTGYVGLVTGVCLAEIGHSVMCADIDQKKINDLNTGLPPIYEEDLEPLLHSNLQAKRLTFTTNLIEAVQHGEILIIAVGTPSRADGSANTDFVMNVAETIATHLNKNVIVVSKSTVPIGTATLIQATIDKILTQRKVSYQAYIVSNPEFLREGSAIRDFMNPDRIVVGTDQAHAETAMRTLYAPLLTKGVKLFCMKTQSAELTKYAANAFLATKVSFINEISQIAEIYHADIKDIKLGIGSDARINPSFLNAGCGYGGSCFPKDVLALTEIAQQSHFDPYILKAVLKRNEKQKYLLFDKIKLYFNNNLRDKTIALWGLAFKPNTDDIRSAPSCAIMELLWQEGANVQAYDPLAMGKIRKAYPDQKLLHLVETAEAALINADALAIITEWDIFASQDPCTIKKHLRNPVVFDGRNIFDAQEMRHHQIKYFGIAHGLSIYSYTTATEESVAWNS